MSVGANVTKPGLTRIRNDMTGRSVPHGYMHLRAVLPIAVLLLALPHAQMRAQSARTKNGATATSGPTKDDERRPEVKELRLVGVKSLNSGELRRALATQE